MSNFAGSLSSQWRHQRARFLAGISAIALFSGGSSAIGVALTSQHHAPQPTASAAGSLGPRPPQRSVVPRQRRRRISPSITTVPATQGPVLARSVPVTIDIQAIGVHSALQQVGLNPDGTIQVPQAGPDYNQAAWYNGSPTPGELGPSIIEGHIDSAAEGPSVFFRLGALVPGDQVDVTLADGIDAVFTVSGVRQYPKAGFPTSVVYGNTDFAALRLITCGGTFDSSTGHYLNNTVVFAALSSLHPALSR